MGVSVLFTAVYLAALALCLFFAWRRPWIRSLATLGVSLAALGGSFLLTRLAAPLWSGWAADVLGNTLRTACGLDSPAAVRETATRAASSFAASLLLGTAIFLFLCLLLWIVGTAVKAYLFRKASRGAGTVPEAAKPRRALSLAASLLSFGALSFALLFPLGALSDVVASAADACERPLSASVLTNPVARVYGIAGRPFFDGLTETASGPKDVNSLELQRAAEIAMAAQNIAEGGASGENADRMARAFRASTMLPDVAGELVANGAASWRAGLPFLHREPRLPEGRAGELAGDVLDVLSRWTTENLMEDLETAVDLCTLLREYDIRGPEDGEVLFRALAQEPFTERLFLGLSGCSDLTALIPKVIRFGVGSALDAMKIEMNEDLIVELDAGALTKEEWREEAAIFSRLLSHMGLLAEGKFDLADLADDFRAASDSRLIGNLIANLAIQIIGALAGSLFG